MHIVSHRPLVSASLTASSCLLRLTTRQSFVYRRSQRNDGICCTSYAGRRTLHESLACQSTPKDKSNITLDLPVSGFTDDPSSEVSLADFDNARIQHQSTIGVGPDTVIGLTVETNVDDDAHTNEILKIVENSSPAVAQHQSSQLTQEKASPAARRSLPIPVYITGGSGVLAGAIAQAFACHPTYPFQITLVGRSAARLQSRIQRLPDSADPKWPHTFMETDVTHSGCWKTDEPVWRSSPQQGKHVVPAILINCAGAPDRGLLSASTELDLLTAVQVNLNASIWSCRAFASRRFRAKRKAMMDHWTHVHFTPSIVTVGSILGQYGGIGAPAYAAAKAGLLGLTRSAAAEFGRMGIRVNAVVPGLVRSQMTETAFASQIEKELEQVIPLRRMGTPEEVADAVVFLALNNYANNCVLNLDGGLSAVGPLDRYLKPLAALATGRDPTKPREAKQPGKNEVNVAVDAANVSQTDEENPLAQDAVTGESEADFKLKGW